MFGLFGGPSFKAKDIPDLSGKVILVTGGNAGLGKESVLQLAKHNPKEIFLAARIPSKAETAIEEIKKAVPNATITFLELDLTDFASIQQAATTFTSKSDRLDVLLNNAGVMALPYSKTKQDYEIQFGTNHMGHALLTKLLLPTLLKTAEQPDADVRIINLSSAGHQLAPSTGIIFDQAQLEICNTWTRYGNSKLANILHARSLSEKYPQITSAAVHPGVIMTDLYATTSKNSNFVMRWGMGIAVGMFMTDVPAGTLNQLWACTAPREEVRKSVFFNPVGKASGGTKHARDEALAEKLWEYTEDELKKHGF